MFELPPKQKTPDLSKGMRSELMLLLAISGGKGYHRIRSDHSGNAQSPG
jgi:hypothetical protein